MDLDRMFNLEPLLFIYFFSLATILNAKRRRLARRNFYI